MPTLSAIALAGNASVMLIVFCIALVARLEDADPFVHRPRLLVRSLASMYVVAPVIAVCVGLILDLDHALRAALVVLALSPVPPILPRKELAIRGSASYAVVLLGVATLVSIVVLPIGLGIVGWLIGRVIDVPYLVVARVVLVSVLLPFGAGLLLRRAAPAFALRIAKPLSNAAIAILLVAVMAIMVAARQGIVAEARPHALLAIALATAAGLASGHLLGGPTPGDRNVLALSTAARHPGVALAVCNALEPEDPTLTAGVLLYFLVGTTLSLAYLAVRARLRA